MTHQPGEPGNGGRPLPATQQPVRVVVDTNVWLRYLIKPSAAIKELIETWWLTGRLQVIAAPELLAELRGVLARSSIQRFVQPAEGAVLLETIVLLAELTPPLGPIPPLSRDPKDDKFVACAVAGQAPHVITVDEDLLILAEVSGVRMTTPYHFLAWLKEKPGSAE
jgi:putative PIN family toxin of toxin-antitoxin system